jgi:hypothetical protein
MKPLTPIRRGWHPGPIHGELVAVWCLPFRKRGVDGFFMVERPPGWRSPYRLAGMLRRAAVATFREWVGADW